MTKLVTCSGCGEGNLFWAWHFGKSVPYLRSVTTGVHLCPSPVNQRDVFPGWCTQCSANDLVWLRKKDYFELTESYGLPHTCPETSVMADINVAKQCICGTQDLLWVKKDHWERYSLRDIRGNKHICAVYDQKEKDWAEAKRINYAIEKAWIKSIPDGHKCKKCNGNGYTTFISKSKKTISVSGQPAPRFRHCKTCKQIGLFTPQKKANYLKNLRSKYWPYRSGFHKWKKGWV